MASYSEHALDRARSLFNAGDYSGVLCCLAKAAEKCASSNPSWYVLQARALQLAEQPGPLSEITACFERALRLDPVNVPALLEYGWFLLDVEDNAEAAEARFRECLGVLKGQNTEVVIGIAKCRSESVSAAGAESCPETSLNDLLDSEEVRRQISE